MKKFNNIVVDSKVLSTLEYLQNDETVIYYDGLLATCIRAAIEDSDLFTDEEAIDIIRGLHNLRQDLRNLAPSDLSSPLDPTGLPDITPIEEREEDSEEEREEATERIEDQPREIIEETAEKIKEEKEWEE